MPRQIHATVEDDTFRRVKVLAAEADVTISGLLRSVIATLLDDPKLQRKVVEGVEPDRRGGARR